MEKLLEKYLMMFCGSDEIYIGGFIIDGATCVVTYYTDSSRYYKEFLTINIWDMFIFDKEN